MFFFKNYNTHFLILKIQFSPAQCFYTIQVVTVKRLHKSVNGDTLLSNTVTYFATVPVGYRGVCLPSLASSLSTDMGTQQFTDGSQLSWLWAPRNCSDPVQDNSWVLLAKQFNISNQT